MAQKCDSTQFHEDQEDLLMSYLNSDYMSSAAPCWTHHPPTPSSTPTLQSPNTADLRQSFFDPNWNHPNTPTGEPILNEFPFMLPDQPIIPYHTYSYFNQPASPPSSSCSSDTEQRIKRRGRKKRDSCTTTTPLPPTVIAPAAVKQLPIILPAQQEKRSTPSCYGNVNKYTPIVKQAPNDTQKAATIAKRQERLIKNRAAALLSRKRKREHLSALEDQKNGLSNENDELRKRVIQLELENIELKNKLQAQNDGKSVMIFMMILFSFAYLVSTAMRLTVNNTTTTKLPFTKSMTNNTANHFQCYSDDEEQLVFGLKERYTSLKRRRFERVIV